MINFIKEDFLCQMQFSPVSAVNLYLFLTNHLFKDKNFKYSDNKTTSNIFCIISLNTFKLIIIVNL